MVSSRDLLVRRTARFDIVLPARVSVAPEHAELVKLSRGSGHKDGWISCNLLDLSAGGAGIVTPVFLPRKVRLRLEVFHTGAEGVDPVLTTGVIVQRVTMTDRRPAYLVGVSFDQSDEASQKSIRRFINELDSAMGGDVAEDASEPDEAGEREAAKPEEGGDGA